MRGKEDPFLKVGEVNDRTKKSESEYVWALDNVNFEISQGEVLGVIGKNGAGKSTLLKLLSRVTGPSKGSVPATGDSAAGRRARPGCFRSAARNSKPGMRRQAIMGTYVLHEHLFACQGVAARFARCG